MYYFRHMLLETFKSAIEKSASICLKQSGNDEQTKFYVNKSKVMQASYALLKSIEVPMKEDGETPNWDAYKGLIRDVLQKQISEVEETAKVYRAKKSNLGVEFSVADFQEYCNNLSKIYNNMYGYFNLPLFVDHCNQDHENYVHEDALHSPWYNQFIHLCLSYQSNKRVDVIVSGQRDTKTYEKKWSLLMENLITWTDLEKSDITPVSKAKSISNMLKSLINSESDVQLQKSSGKTSYFANYLYSGFLAPVVSVVTGDCSTGGTLGPLLTNFQARFDIDYQPTTSPSL